MITTIVYAVPYLLAFVILWSLASAIITYRRSRTATYFRIRQEASQQAGQWVLTIIGAGIGIAAALLARQYVDVPGATSTDISPDQIITPVILFPTSTFVSGDSIPPSITPTNSIPDVTETPPVPTVESDVSVSDELSLRITAISSGVSSDREPVNAGDSFPAGTQRIYFWIEFVEMVDGVSWTQVLLLNGNSVRTESEIWANGTTGTAFYWFDAQGGWPAGNYEIQFYVGDVLAASGTFAIID